MECASNKTSKNWWWRSYKMNGIIKRAKSNDFFLFFFSCRPFDHSFWWLSLTFLVRFRSFNFFKWIFMAFIDYPFCCCRLFLYFIFILSLTIWMLSPIPPNQNVTQQIMVLLFAFETLRFAIKFVVSAVQCVYKQNGNALQICNTL